MRIITPGTPPDPSYAEWYIGPEFTCDVCGAVYAIEFPADLDNAWYALATRIEDGPDRVDVECPCCHRMQQLHRLNAPRPTPDEPGFSGFPHIPPPPTDERTAKHRRTLR